jgi:ribosomal protein S18 acetylase RimI-like enzyme
MSDLKFFECDFDEPLHIKKLVELMNHYRTDKMGGVEAMSESDWYKFISNLQHHPTSLVFFVEYDGEIVALSNCFLNYSTFALKPFVNIHDFVVIDKVRGKGIGKALMNGILERAKNIGCSKVTLEVRDDNAVAQHVYKELGFDDCQPLMHYWEKKF